MKVIYDIGANNGSNIPYYLEKCDLVVAVEANPVLCSYIRNTYTKAIEAGSLIVEECVITDQVSGQQVPFFIHKENDVLSQFPRPDDIGNFKEVLLPSRNVIDIINTHGNPYYIKIDIEHYDQFILASLFKAGIKPKFISAEAHHAEVLEYMIAAGYQSFKLVGGASVSQNFFNHPIVTDSGTKIYSFPHHSAGPFGEDIPGPWMNSSFITNLLKMVGLGWVDIHGTTGGT